MTRCITILAAIFGLIAPASLALGQIVPKVVEIICPREPVRFVGCNISPIEFVRTGRVGIVGKITRSEQGAYSFYKRKPVDVQQASIENISPHIMVDFDPCMLWDAGAGDVINVYLWERVGPHSGAYTLAPCPN